MRGGNFNLLGTIGLPVSQPSTQYYWVGDVDGDVYKLDSDGNVLNTITSTASFRGVYVDSNENVYIGRYSDGTLTKFDKNNNVVWTKYPFSTNAASSYVGYNDTSVFAISYLDGTIIEYDLDGNIIYQETFFDDAYFAYVDNNNDLFMTWNSSASDGYLRKHDSNRNYVWQKNHTNKLVSCVTSDDQGNVYTTDYSGAVKKLDSNGDVIWTNTSHTSDYLYEVVLDSQNNIYSSGGNGDNSIRKISQGNSLVWTFSLGTQLSTQMVIDDDDNLIICVNDGRVIKLDQNKNVIWDKQICPSNAYAAFARKL